MEDITTVDYGVASRSGADTGRLLYRPDAAAAAGIAERTAD
jgi:hypothetical protein